MAKKRYEIIATAMDKKGRVLSSCKNDYTKSHPLFKSYSVRSGMSEQRIYSHAEFLACIKASAEIHTVLVQRFHTDGSLANAEPCNTCKLVLKEFGVKRVQYTHEDGIKEFIL